MTGMTDHVCMNILYKDLSCPKFKEYYTLDEINKEMMEYEDTSIEPYDDSGQAITDVVFHMSYRSFLFTVNQLNETTEEESVLGRVYRFMDMARVK